VKKIILFLSLVLFFGCSNEKIVYWCGDHRCLNKKEKENYFKETMVIEIKELNAKKKTKYSDIEKILQQNNKGEKEKIKNEKKLAREAYQEEKKRMKSEKKLAKKTLREKKKLDKKNKKILKINKNIEIKNSVSSTDISSSEFGELAEKISKKNNSKQYPDINDIPN